MFAQILVVDPKHRASLDDVRSHPWVTAGMTAREMHNWMPAARLAATPSEADMRAAVQEGVEELPEAPVRAGAGACLRARFQRTNRKGPLGFCALRPTVCPSLSRH